METNTIFLIAMIVGIVGAIALVITGAVIKRVRVPEEGPYRKPRADAYTILLLIALIAVVLGSLCLYIEMDLYFWELKNPAAERGLRAPL